MALREPRASRVWALAWAVVLLFVGGVHGATRVELSSGAIATLTEDQRIYLEAVPLRGEGLLGFARRLCGTSELATEVAAANNDARSLLAGVRYRVPLALLAPEHQLEVLRGIFAADEISAAGWRHRVGPATRGREELWSVAQWFTGRGDNYRAIREYNQLADDQLEPGQTVVIPASLLRPVLRVLLPEASEFKLDYESDRLGEYARYRLKAGEALYSSVVVRFTGRVFADDVNALAAEIAERSGIRDVTDIPVGYAVKVPFDLLLPEFLPAGHPRRREYEQGLAASSRFSNSVRADRLSGVHVILDAGHGGSDVGASMGGVWESLYAYDIALRVKRVLESSTAARVEMTSRDGREYRVPERDVLPYSRSRSILTDPEYPIGDSKVALHLRWYLANSLFARATAAGADPRKVVFLSVHADSLHPSLRGAMAYVPGARYTGGTYGKSGAVYASRREVRERPQVSFSSQQRVRSEGLSRDLAQNVIDAFSRGGLAVHDHKPIREKVIRKRSAWVPAVLRYNAVPAKILLEVCNLTNSEDRSLLQTRAYRQQVAEAIVDGIVHYYGDAALPTGAVATTAARR